MKEIKETMKELYPLDSQGHYQEYRKRKYAAMALAAITGIGAAVCIHLSSRMENRLSEGTRLVRNEWGEGAYTVELKGTTASGEGEMTYEVKERVFTEEELAGQREEAEEKLLEIISGENESLLAVSRNLNLVTEIEGYPFRISWQSGDNQRVGTDGKVNTANLPAEGEEVKLTAVFRYGEESWEKEITLRLLPRILTKEEQYLAAMQELLSENDSLYEESSEIRLPETMDGEAISWEEKKRDLGVLFLPAGILGAGLVSLGMDSSLQKKRKKRKQELTLSYPEFVSKLQLYMGAGLTLRNAFMRIGGEYVEEKEKTGKRKFLYEEILIACYQLRNGRAEDEVLREWGKRCGVSKYRKLSFLLISHFKQGNDRLLLMLAQEADMALEERLSRARRLGEEAGTKLLFPMMLMLVVVMVLILLPAISGFGIL